MMFRRKVRVTYQPRYQPRLTRPRPKIPWKRIAQPIVVALLVAMVGYVVLASPLVRVRQIDIKGAESADVQNLTEQVRQVLRTTLLGNNILFLSGDHVASELKNRDFTLGEVNVKKAFFNKLVVEIGEERPTLGWKSGDKLYVLSSEGKALQVVNSGNWPIVSDSANLPVQLGQKVVPTSFISFTVDLVAALKGRGVQISSMSVPETTGELYVTTNEKYLIKFDTGRTVESQLVDLDAVIKSLASQNKRPTEYIDLRIPGRVFYK